MNVLHFIFGAPPPSSQREALRQAEAQSDENLARLKLERALLQSTLRKVLDDDDR